MFSCTCKSVAEISKYCLFYRDYNHESQSLWLTSGQHQRFPRAELWVGVVETKDLELAGPSLCPLHQPLLVLLQHELLSTFKVA